MPVDRQRLPSGIARNKKKWDERKKRDQRCGCNKCQQRGKKGKPKRKKCRDQCPVGGRRKGKGALTRSCFVAGTLVAGFDGTLVPIESIRPGAEVRTWLGGELSAQSATGFAPGWVGEPSERAVWLVQEWGAGERTEVGLLRPLSWLGGRGVGDRVVLDLPELGATGEFQVVAVEPGRGVASGRGGRVTGVFRHSRGRVYNLWLAGEPGPVGVTGRHRVWCVDRGDWTAVGRLRPGERVQTAGGTAVVFSLVPKLCLGTHRRKAPLCERSSGSARVPPSHGAEPLLVAEVVGSSAFKDRSLTTSAMKTLTRSIARGFVFHRLWLTSSGRGGGTSRGAA